MPRRNSRPIGTSRQPAPESGSEIAGRVETVESVHVIEEGSVIAEEHVEPPSRVMELTPRVCQIIDPLAPRLLIECTYEGLDRKVREIFSEVTKGEDWSTANIDEFYAVWDLRKAAKGRSDTLR